MTDQYFMFYTFQMGNIIGGPGAALGGTSVPVVGTGPAVVGIPRPLSPGLNYGERCDHLFYKSN